MGWAAAEQRGEGAGPGGQGRGVGLRRAGPAKGGAGKGGAWAGRGGQRMEMIKVKGPIGIGKAVAYKGDKIATEAELTFAIM